MLSFSELDRPSCDVIINCISSVHKTVTRSQSEETLETEVEEVYIPTPVVSLGMFLSSLLLLQ